MKELRPHQEKAITLLKQSLGNGNKQVMIQAPTGFGKTVVASHLVKENLEEGKRTCFVVPNISLIDQTVASLFADGITDIGVIQADHPMTNYAMPVQVASVQTICNRKIPHFDMIIVDEAHKWFKFIGDWMVSWNNVPFVGLSATPWTKGLGKHYKDLIVAATTQELIDEGYLSPFRVFAPSHPDLDGVKTVLGDYHEGQLSKVMQDSVLIADIVSTWKKMAKDRPTLAFCVDRAHAKKVCKQFKKAGVPCGYIDAYTPREERLDIAKKFQQGKLKVVASVGCLTTGIDWDVRCIILARPTKSEILFTQIIGRGLRTAEGKDDCLILDHSDTHLKLGFVTDIHHEHLDDGKGNKSGSREIDEPLPKDCGACGFLKPPRVYKCPSCGFEPEKVSEIEPEAGELKEFKPKVKDPKDYTRDDKEEFYGGLIYCGEQRGYKPGWAANQFRNKFGVWPNAYNDCPAIPPNSDVRGWIKMQAIQYRKRMESQENAA